MPPLYLYAIKTVRTISTCCSGNTSPLLWRETADWLYSTSSNFPYCNEYTFTDIGSAVLGCGTASAIIDVGLFYTTPTTSEASSQSVPGGLVSSLTSAVSYPSSSSQLTSSVSVTNTPTPTPFTQSQQSFGGSPTATKLRQVMFRVVDRTS